MGCEKLEYVMEYRNGISEMGIDREVITRGISDGKR